MILLTLLSKSQLPLFEKPVHIAGSVRKDGSYVKPHVRLVRVKVEPAKSKGHQASLFDEPVEPSKPAKETKLDTFIRKKGGVRALGAIIATMTQDQQEKIFEELGKLGGKSAEDVAAMFGEHYDKAPERGETPDLFADAAHIPEPASEPEPTLGQKDLDDTDVVKIPEIIEHVTGRGKVLRGIVRTDLTLDQAKEIDPYAFRKNGGVFIREKHLGKLTAKPNRENSAAESQQVEPKTSETSEQKGSPETPAREPAKPRVVEAGTPFGVVAGTSKQRRREINAEAASIINSGRELTDADRAILRQYSGNGGCGDSLNEFYTDPDVAAAMWTVLDRLGVSSGNVLEPSCATGVFMHTAPGGFRVTGVEMDPTSSAIAEALHGDRHAVVNSSLER